MGAIFGVVGTAGDDVLTEMGRRLAHRAAEVHTARPFPDVALGAVSIEGASPIVVDGDEAIVAAGTLYDETALRAELGLAAAPPRRAVAETLLHVHRRWGPAGIDRVRGDFAAVLVRADAIVVLRDFLGVRPLFHARLPSGGIVFGTEYKAVLAHPYVVAAADPQMVQDLQCTKKVPNGRTLMRDVHEMLPGTATTLGRDGSVRGVHATPGLPIDIKIRDEATAIRAIRDGLRDAALRRTAPFERLGIALSGGIDSIATAFQVRKLYPDRELHTFCSGDGADDPEMITAAQVARRIGAVHHEVVVTPDRVASEIESLVRHLEDPFSRSEALQLMLIGRAAKGKVDVLLTGQAADIEFAGMQSYKLFWMMQQIPIGFVRKGLHEFSDLQHYGRPPRTWTGRLFDRLYNRSPLAPPPRVPGTKLPDLSELPPMGDEFVNYNLAGYCQNEAASDAHKSDRGFAASGIEYTSLFYDLDFMRLAYTITDRLKIKGGKGKYIFRKALEGIVDDEFRDVPKRPQRMRYDLAMADAMDALAARYLTPEIVKARGFFEPATVAALIRKDKAQRYSPEAAMRIWTAALTEIWARQFVDRRGAAH